MGKILEGKTRVPAIYQVPLGTCPVTLRVADGLHINEHLQTDGSPHQSPFAVTNRVRTPRGKTAPHPCI